MPVRPSSAARRTGRGAAGPARRGRRGVPAEPRPRREARGVRRRGAARARSAPGAARRLVRGRARHRAGPPGHPRRAPVPRRRPRPARPLGRRDRRDVEADPERRGDHGRVQGPGGRPEDRCSRASRTSSSSAERPSAGTGAGELRPRDRHRRRPGPLEPLLERLGIDARLEGAFEPERNVLVTRLGDPERTIDVEGPAGYEPEDLVDDLDGRSRPPRRVRAG